MAAPALLAAALLATPDPADAARRARTHFDGLRDCERAGTQQLMRLNPSFRNFTVDRARVSADRHAAQVGGRFVSTVYHGRAVYDGGLGSKPARFICLHGGFYRRVVFFYLMPD